MILAGDVGGTKTALALFDERDGGLTVVREATLRSHDFESLEAVVGRLLGSDSPGPIDVACFGVPGPVVDGRSVTINLPWEVEEGKLAREIGASRVKLVNDLEAASYGMLGLPASAMTTLQSGNPKPGPRVLIAAGTGLGEAILVWDGRRHTVMASEGGHADFAPRNEREIELLRFLMREFDRVSYERVLSGPGLHNIYRFLVEATSRGIPEWLEAKLAAGDPSQVISEVALAGGDPSCVEALDLFVSIYGAEAGNLALKALAIGGVYVAGGIAPKIRSKLEDGRFVAAFRDKGRLASLMASIPVVLALDPRAPLLGAARIGKELVERGRA
jgi:glucokinase